MGFPHAASGADFAYVSNHLGHVNPSTTLRIYSHWVPGTRRVTTSILDSESASIPDINSQRIRRREVEPDPLVR